MAAVKLLISSSLLPGLGNNRRAYSTYAIAPMPGIVSMEQHSTGCDPTNRPEIAHEQRLFPVSADSGNEPITQHDSRDATKNQNETAQHDQSPDCDARALRHVEFVPRHGSTEEHERCEIQQRLDRRIERVVAGLDLGIVESVPV